MIEKARLVRRPAPALAPWPMLTRRHFLRVGAVAVSGFELLPVLRPFNVTASEKVKLRGTAEYCVFVFLQGGASHVDTFDIKEGRWTPPDFDVRTVQPKLRMPAGLFPKLSQIMDRVAIVRSLETWETEHGRATYYLHVAHPVSPARAREMPSLGAVVAYEFDSRRKTDDFLPPFVSMNYGPDQVKEGCLHSKFTPLNLDTKSEFAFVVPENERARFERRVQYLNTLATLAPGADSTATLMAQQLDAYRSQALTMMRSPKLPKILHLEEEEKKRYGGSAFGDSCILTRNLLAAEAGTRFIAIHHGSWDFHTNIYDKGQGTTHYSLSRELDAGLATMITDMKDVKTADGRSLLEKTLIVCLGEFGRTPGDITVNKGRDHHRFAMSGLFAGGGVVGGHALGITDDQGAKVIDSGWSKKRSIYPEDVAVTIYSALGIDWTKDITNTPSGRAFRYVDPMSGTDFLDVAEISELFA